MEQINPDLFVTFDRIQAALATSRGFNTIHIRESLDPGRRKLPKVPRGRRWANFRSCKMARTDDHKAMNATVAKAKEQFCDIVSRAEVGKVTTVTRHNKPVACIVPAMLPAKKLTEEWRQRRKAIRLNRPGLEPLSVSQLIQEGRK